MTATMIFVVLGIVASLALGLVVAALLFIRPENPRRAWRQVWIGLAMVLSLYPAVAWQVFAIRHPLAGQGVFWTEFRAVMTFRTVARFQP